ncbi:hypothetical protein B0O99DRAFT_45436 [Bisporella sp. PMI_857]|nr:hypothetical protein B0O99DRAFT_45436 [Bisporella sp. PMI_857]
MQFTKVFVISLLGYLSATPVTAYPAHESQSLQSRAPSCSISSIPGIVGQLEKAQKNLAEAQKNIQEGKKKEAKKLLTTACSAVAKGKPVKQCHSGSNVDIASELVQMISAQRAYEANQKAVETASAAMCNISKLI